MPAPSRRRDAPSGIALVLLAVVYFAAAERLPPVGNGGPGPSFFPVLLAAALLALGIALVIEAARAPAGLSAEPPATSRRPLALAAASFVYLLAFSVTGFFASTFLYAFAITWIFGSKLVSGIFVSLVTTLAVYGLFAYVLSVPLP